VIPWFGAPFTSEIRTHVGATGDIETEVQCFPKIYYQFHGIRWTGCEAGQRIGVQVHEPKEFRPLSPHYFFLGGYLS
jgi:hypothetical protein